MKVASLDLISQRILTELKMNGRISWGELSGIVGISRQSLTKRIETLERHGIIQGYTVVTSHRNNCKITSVKAFLKLRFAKDKGWHSLSALLPSYKNVISSWLVAGQWDCMILVEVDCVSELSEIKDLLSESGDITEIEIEVILRNFYKK